MTNSSGLRFYSQGVEVTAEFWRELERGLEAYPMEYDGRVSGDLLLKAYASRSRWRYAFALILAIAIAFATISYLQKQQIDALERVNVAGATNG